MRDKRWYGADGGVTVSGGEPLTQVRFVTAPLRMCRDQGIGTCIETCGAVLCAHDSIPLNSRSLTYFMISSDDRWGMFPA